MVLLAGRKDFKTRLLLTWEIYAGWSTPLFDPISRWCSRLEILQWKSWDALIRFSLCGHYDLPATRKKKVISDKSEGNRQRKGNSARAVLFCHSRACVLFIFVCFGASLLQMPESFLWMKIGERWCKIFFRRLDMDASWTSAVFLGDKIHLCSLSEPDSGFLPEKVVWQTSWTKSSAKGKSCLEVKSVQRMGVGEPGAIRAQHCYNIWR